MLSISFKIESISGVKTACLYTSPTRQQFFSSVLTAITSCANSLFNPGLTYTPEPKSELDSHALLLEWLYFFYIRTTETGSKLNRTGKQENSS